MGKSWQQWFEEAKQGKSDDECWEVPPIPSGGRRLVCHNNTRTPIYRVVYLNKVGELPDDLYVCHSCDNPNCVNPKHLFLGTQLDNLRDMANKGRSKNNPRIGSNHQNAKLVERDVVDIRKRFAAGDSKSDLAAEYDVSFTVIFNVVNRKYWRHVL